MEDFSAYGNRDNKAVLARAETKDSLSPASSINKSQVGGHNMSTPPPQIEVIREMPDQEDRTN